jgi:DNA primase large subunit
VVWSELELGRKPSSRRYQLTPWCSPDLRTRFVRSETSLFRQRFETDDVSERSAFLRSLQLDWQQVDESEKAMYAEQLRGCMAWGTKEDAFRAETWFKVGGSARVLRV